MAFLDFKKAGDLPDGLTSELLENETIQSFIKTEFDKRSEVQVSGLKTNLESIKEEKQKLQGYLDQYKSIDLDEYERLKELEKNNGDATSQLNRLQTEKDAIEDTYKTKLTSLEEKYNTADEMLLDEKRKNYISQSIAQHNTDYPALKVKAGAEKYLIDAAKPVFSRDEKGGFTPMDGDTVLTGEDGIMKGSEWVNHMRSKEPLFFESPKGSGANGSGGSGGRGFNPKDMAGSQDERKAAIAAKFNL